MGPTDCPAMSVTSNIQGEQIPAVVEAEETVLYSISSTAPI